MKSKSAKIAGGLFIILLGLTCCLASVLVGAVLKYNCEPYLFDAIETSSIICGIFSVLVGGFGLITFVLGLEQ